MTGHTKALVYSAILGISLFSGCFIFDMGPASNETTGPHVTVAGIFSTSSFIVYTQRPAWSPDGQTIVFQGSSSTGHTNTALWKVAAIPGSNPVLIGAGEAYCPHVLSNGKLVYYQGWIDNDQNMHIMITDMSITGDSLQGTILRSFNGSDVGLAHNSAASPSEMSMSDDSSRVFIIWENDSACVLKWNNADSLVMVNKIQSPVQLGTISPDGSKIAYTRADGALVWALSDGGIETEISQGLYPAWNAAGTHVGYVNGTTYGVYTVTSRDQTWYALSSTVQYPSLSPAGNKFVFRTWGAGAENGLSLGTLAAE